MHNGYSLSAIEAMILAAPEPLPAARVASVLDGATPSKVAHAVAELNNRYMVAGTSFRIREVAGGFQFYVLPEYAGFVEELFARQRKLRLTRAALETLAIVAYKQPVSRVEIEQIRGVNSDAVMNTLLDRKLITMTGRAATVGRPLQYGTTDEFLKFFGLNSLEELPSMTEIEELIKTSGSKDQTELSLGDGQPLKLNVADGSFVPVGLDPSDSPVEAAIDSSAARSTTNEAEAAGGEDHEETVSVRRLVMVAPGGESEVELIGGEMPVDDVADPLDREHTPSATSDDRSR